MLSSGCGSLMLSRYQLKLLVIFRVSLNDLSCWITSHGTQVCQFILPVLLVTVLSDFVNFYYFLLITTDKDKHVKFLVCRFAVAGTGNAVINLMPKKVEWSELRTHFK